MKHTTEVIGTNTAEWRNESEFRFLNFITKAMAFLTQGTIKKQSQKYLNDFKAFAKHGKSISKVK